MTALEVQNYYRAYYTVQYCITSVFVSGQILHISCIEAFQNCDSTVL